MVLCRLAAAALFLSPAAALRKAGAAQDPQATQPVEQAPVAEQPVAQAPAMVQSKHIFTMKDYVWKPMDPEEMKIALEDHDIPREKLAKSADHSEVLPKVYPPLRKYPGATINPEGRIITGGEFFDQVASGYQDTLFYGCSYGPTSDGNTLIVPANTTPYTPSEEVVVLTQPFKGAMFHTVAEALTRLEAIKAREPTLMTTAKFHLGTTAQWAIDWAFLFGLQPDQIIDGWVTCGGNCIWPESNPCARGDTTMYRDSAAVLRMQAYSAVAVTPLPYEPPAPGNPAYTMRGLFIRSEQKRKVENEYDVVHLMKINGLYTRILDEKNLPTVLEQCVEFFCANVIVSPYHQLLVGLLCARPGVAVIEYHQLDPNDQYQYMANKLQLGYHGVPAGLPHGDKGTVSIKHTRTRLRAAFARMPAHAKMDKCS